MKRILLVIFYSWYLCFAVAQPEDERHVSVDWEREIVDVMWRKSAIFFDQKNDEIFLAGVLDSNNIDWIQLDKDGNEIVRKLIYFDIPFFVSGINIPSRDELILVGDKLVAEGDSQYLQINHFRIDSNILLWDCILPNTFSVSIRSVLKNTKGKYILAGSQETNENKDFFSFCLNHEKEIIWTQSFGGKTGEEQITAIHQNENGDLLLSGYQDLFATQNYRSWIVELDAGGEFIKDKTIGTDNASSKAISTLPYQDQKILLSDWQHSTKLILIKANGDIAWEETFEFQGSSLQALQMVQAEREKFLLVMKEENEQETAKIILQKIGVK